MWIVRLALRRPYTFIVMSVLIVIMGILSIIRTPKDIFPDIDIPVISVIWTYNGLSTQDFEQRITIYSEFALSSNVNDIERMESQTIDGVGIIRLYFHPGVKISDSLAQATAVSQAILRRMPPSVQPPIILRYTAASVPIVQMSLASDQMSETDLYDYGIFRIRTQVAVINGITLPTPYGGKVRTVMVDLDPNALHARGLSAREVNDAITVQNLVLPNGRARIAETDYRVTLNNSPGIVERLNDIPIKTVNGVPIFVRDVAYVHDGAATQTNIVRTNGVRGTLLTILRNGNASTLDIVNGVKKLLPSIQASAPPGMKIGLLFDQSTFVSRAIESVWHEGLIAAVLTGAAILLFLGSWRSTLIVLISIPLSILTSIALLSALGYSINVMTLGGLALAIGILVDDATVEIENIHRNLAMGKPLQQAILDGAQQIAVPAFVATLAICIVFVPVVLLEGPAKFLFVPFALAVVFAVFTSYILSRTVVPVLVKYLLASESHSPENATPTSLFGHIHKTFNDAFERFRSLYVNSLAWALGHRLTILAAFGILLGSAFIALPLIGRDFFPVVDAGQIRMHVVAPSGTRLEQTEKIFSQVEAEIRNIIPAEDVDMIIDNMGVPSEQYNLAFGDSATLGTQDGEILIALKHERKKGAPAYAADLRTHLKQKFPGLTFYFQPADIVSQILNFGLKSPIDIRITGYNKAQNLEIARAMRDKIAKIPGAVDVHIHQDVAAPELRLEVDRTRLAESGITQQNVANDLMITLASSSQVTPNYWVDPVAGRPYLIAVKTPVHLIDSTDSLLRTPIATKQGESQILGNFATLGRGASAGSVSHLNIQPVYDIFANVQGRDLGGVIDDIRKVIAEYEPQLAPGNRILVKGLVTDMDSAFTHLGIGFIAAIILVYFLMVVNYQSWLDPFIIITALPGAFAGIIWGLYLTGTTLNVPSLMGAMMAVGVATANSILMVTFANQQMLAGKDSIGAALTAGSVRLRPVLMTALAMVLGMLPMSLALGEGGEQNAPLGRAVIGGLSLATLATLFFVPVVFSLLRRVPNPILAEDTEVPLDALTVSVPPVEEHASAK
ncbi:MAG TPA: efflux RND transporter permease subunit [Chthoniobacter sp.]|nr:efflux RND transporter permease subunit [Chthoniobacter sp.]